MLDDSFRLRYKNVPAAISVQDGYGDTLLHNHSEIEVLMIEEGESRVRVGGEGYICAKGDLIFVNPMEIHSVAVNKNYKYRHRCICFEASLISDKSVAEGIKSGHLHLPAYIKNGDNTELFGMADRLFAALEKESIAVELEVRAYVSLMAANLIKRGLLIKAEHISGGDKFCEDALAYVHEHFCDTITSKTAACALSFNQSYFCRSFRKKFGMSFSSYLNMYRVSISKRLLECAEKSISDVAEECGFTDPLYFSRCFKRYVGMLPSEYRKKSI